VFGIELLLIYIIWYSPLRCAASVILPGPVLLVTAHPDDEAMFFTPTLLWFQKAGIPVDLLCFSAGDFDGLGSVRHTELLNAAKHFGIRHLRIIDNPDEFPDNPCCDWPYDSIASQVRRTCTEWGIETVVTFDTHGVSLHPNHCALSRAIYLDRKFSRSSPYSELYFLKSLPVYRKYFSIVDATCDLIFAWRRTQHLTLLVPFRMLYLAYTSMLAHRSQLLWYRWLYIWFSVYMYKNTLIKMCFNNCGRGRVRHNSTSLFPKTDRGNLNA
ncbi:N-acetylglucosaminylphosphatidylinositol deacetylase, partial [Paragonimus westermani]